MSNTIVAKSLTVNIDGAHEDQNKIHKDSAYAYG